VEDLFQRFDPVNADLEFGEGVGEAHHLIAGALERRSVLA
jgi:hypothetical protein